MSMRDPAKPVEGEPYCTVDWVMESSKEAQEWDRFLPPTCDLPTTHEHFVENVCEVRNGQELTIKRVGVRRKAGAVASEPDNLNELDDATLQVQAVKAGVDWGGLKGKGKSAKVKAIREAREKQPAGA